ncbi:MAG: 2TM domain-containing protein [Hyphomicrobium sp.]
MMKKTLTDPGFRAHLVVYLSVNAFLIILNLLGNSQHLWFYWPLLGWGIGLLAHAAAVNKKQTQ